MTRYPLGRHVDHDPQSRHYEARTAVVARSVLWATHAPVLDQGELGSCTGNAMAQALNTDHFTKRHYLDEDDAVEIYSVATAVDNLPGTYPPQDCGSSGLGAAKAAKQLGYITAYRHCFSFASFCSALQLSPIIVGTNWYSRMFTPNRKGMVSPKGSLCGGHEYLALGISYEAKTLTFLNSWGSGWGMGGRFKMTFSDFAALLANQGDATVPIQ